MEKQSTIRYRDPTPILRHIESKVRQDEMLSGKARRRTHARENTENERLQIRSFHQRTNIETAWYRSASRLRWSIRCCAVRKEIPEGRVDGRQIGRKAERRNVNRARRTAPLVGTGVPYFLYRRKSCARSQRQYVRVYTCARRGEEG